jgi:hypothetical protein
VNAGREKVETEGRCRVCGDGPAWKLEAAHTWDRSLGKSSFDDPDLVVPLCGELHGTGCHQLFDRHSLNLLPYLTLQEQLALVKAAGGIARAMKRAVGV